MWKKNNIKIILIMIDYVKNVHQIEQKWVPNGKPIVFHHITHWFDIK